MDVFKRQKIYKQVNRDRDKLAKRFVPLWEKALKKQVESYNFATDFIDIAPIKDAMMINWVSVGGKFAMQTARQLLNKKSEHEPIIKAAEIDIIIVRMVNEQFAEKIVGISDTTREEIRRLIQIQLDEGNNPRDVARLIRNEMEGINANRALTIARTESIGASNAGSDAGARALNIPLVKTWQAAFINTRDSHANVSGTKIPFDSPFQVGGFPMMRPHDSNLGAPSIEIINCRCVSIKEVAI